MFPYKLRFVKVGSYDGSVPIRQQLQLNQSKIVWTGGLSQVGNEPHHSHELNCIIKKIYTKNNAMFYLFLGSRVSLQ